MQRTGGRVPVEPRDTSLPRVALLIDADNIPADEISTVIADLGPRGLLTVRRAYGNWTSPRLAKWQGLLLRHAVQAIHQFDYATGKNATDMALTIDAMDLLHAGWTDVVALVSSDADFTPLAVRLRSAGMAVIGYGAGQATAAFRSACTEFVELLPQQPATKAPDPPPPKTPAPKTPAAKTPAVQPPAPKAPAPTLPAQKAPASYSQVPTRLLRGDTALMNRLRKAVNSAADPSGWAAMSAVGVKLGDKKLPGRYGYATLSKLIVATDAFHWQQGTSALAVRPKQPV